MTDPELPEDNTVPRNDNSGKRPSRKRTSPKRRRRASFCPHPEENFPGVAESRNHLSSRARSPCLGCDLPVFLGEFCRVS